VTGNAVVKSVCRMCRRACGIDVHLRAGELLEVKGTAENPASAGILCPKGRAIVDYVYSPNRLRHPLKRDGGIWKQIDWDEAIDTIAARLEEIRQRYGARSLAIYIGESASQCEAIEYVRRFLDIYGSPNLFSGGSLCARPIVIGCQLTFGKAFVPEPENSKCIVIWGIDPYNSNRQQTTQILTARKAGAKLIVIDPRRTFFAKRADAHIQPRPGSDCSLALGMLNFIISQGLYDKRFVDRWTVGFEKLREHLANYPPEKVEEASWVPRSAIEEAARIFATTRPAAIIPGSALNHQICAAQNIRALGILQTITGNIDVAGGWIAPLPLRLSPMALPEKLRERPLGEDKYPLFVASRGRVEGQAAVLTDALLTAEPYPVKAMIVAGGNPALSWPDTTKVVKALRKLDFLVVMDVTMTRTAGLADIVLPAATFLETTELHSYGSSGLPYVILRKKALEFPECWPDWKFWFQLAKRMGYEEYFPWSSEEEAIDFLLGPSGITIKDLKENPAGLFYGAKRYKSYEQQGFPTASGKIEIHSTRLKELGHSPLPDPPHQEIVVKEYPLVLTTGARDLEYTHSQFHDISSLRKRAPEPVAEIHPSTAQRYGIAEGKMMSVETPMGKIKIKARVTEDIIPNVVSVPFGWDEPNTNILTGWQNPDPISGLPAFASFSCKIEAA
jgi:anaerobic selenocysteine-containing dehydrogenase